MAQQRAPAYPTFEQFPVERESIHCAAAKFETPQQERDRTWFQNMERRMPTFAGHYCAVEMPCGPDCWRIGMVDARTGKLHGSPFRTRESPFFLPPPNWNSQQPRYTGSSRLMIVPNVCPNVPESCGTFYFLWEGNAFRQIARKPVSAVAVIPARSPLIGKWEGFWTGVTQTYPSTIAITQGRNSELSGTFIEQGPKPKRLAIRRITISMADQSAVRFEMEGNCWNLQVDEDDPNRLGGVWNAGPCTQLGIGGGARLFAVEARRIP